MRIVKVEGKMVRDYKKLSRWDTNNVLIGIINHRYRTTIPIIGDGGPPFEGEDNFEIVRYTDAESEVRKEARVQKEAEDRRKSTGMYFPDDQADFRLAVVPPSDDPRILVSWRVFNCKKFEGKAEILCEQSLPYLYREDDGCFDVSVVNTLECLAIFKPGDTLRSVPIDPSGMYTTNVSGSSFVQGWVYFMHWMTRYGKPFLSVTRKSADAVERRQQDALASKTRKAS